MVVAAPLLMLVALEYILWMFDIAPPPQAGANAPEVPEAGVVQAGWGPEAFHAGMRTVPPNGRVVCLGGSSMAGAPLEKELTICDMVAEALDPPAEVTNLAASALDSRDVRLLATAACQHENRLVLIYSGHNEFLNLRNFVRGKPPEALITASNALQRFRFYRWIQSIAKTDASNPAAAGSAEISNSQVFERYEENVRAVMEACKGQPLIFGTMISNQALRSARGLSPREAHRTGTLRPVGLHDTCRECFRAPDIVNITLTRLSTEFSVPLADNTALLGDADPNTIFWDHVHPKPDLLRSMAGAFLNEAKKAGYITDYQKPSYSVAPERLAWAAADRARFNLRLDPLTAIAQLEASRGSYAPFDDAIALALAAFVLDRSDQFRAEVRAANAILENDTDLAARIADCARQSRPVDCVSLNTAKLMEDPERADLVKQAEKAGASDILLKLLNTI
ncbi:MAG: hypothetical protein ACI9OJ_001295 [Myxococcota bacterium]|jgi:hypothetical protein